MLALAHSVAMLFAARIVDGLSGGNISTARAYVADITEPKDRARAYGIIGAAFGLGFILGPALSGVLAGISYTAPIWAAAGAHAGRDGDGVAVAARNGASRAGRHRQSVQLSAGADAAARRSAAMLTIDFVYWLAFATFQTTFSLFVGAAVRLRRLEDRLFLRRLRPARRGHSGRVHPADRETAGRQADVPAGPGVRRVRAGRGGARRTR